MYKLSSLIIRGLEIWVLTVLISDTPPPPHTHTLPPPHTHHHAYLGIGVEVASVSGRRRVGVATGSQQGWAALESGRGVRVRSGSGRSRRSVGRSIGWRCWWGGDGGGGVLIMFVCVYVSG